jgi:hypothetical protein
MRDDARDVLRRRLSDADPAASAPEMTAAERRQMLSRLQGAAAGKREAAAVPGGLRWAASLGVVALLIALGFWWYPAPPPVGPATLQPAAALAPRVTDLTAGRSTLRPRTLLRPSDTQTLPARRTIHFTAPHGTRLVWQVQGDSNAG